jgi:hypothetical protein
MKKVYPLLLLFVLFSCSKEQIPSVEKSQVGTVESKADAGDADVPSPIPSEPTASQASEDEISTDNSESIPVTETLEETEDGYRMITWWDLFSKPEFLYYKEMEAAYEADPNFYPSSLPPAPGINAGISGLKVRIPGFIVGVDTDPDNFSMISSFLFVPYQGACIHVPPPPTNQTIFSTFEESFQSDPYTPYWLYGTIYTEEGDNGIAAYSYTLVGDRLEIYSE